MTDSRITLTAERPPLLGFTYNRFHSSLCSAKMQRNNIWTDGCSNRNVFNMNAKRTAGNLTYGEFDGKLIFLPSEDASELSTLWTVLKSAKTWDDLERGLPDDRVEEIREFYLGGEAEPDEMTGDAPFDLEEIPAIADGVWPEWPDQMMLDVMPKEVIEEFGTIEESWHEGDLVRFDSACEEAIVSKLTDLGYDLTRDDKLIGGVFG
jgi:hypothetical protein